MRCPAWTVFPAIADSRDPRGGGSARYLRGELRADHPQPLKFHVYEQDSWFSWEADGAYRHNIVRLKAINKDSGLVAFDRELITNHAKVMYDPQLFDPTLFR